MSLSLPKHTVALFTVSTLIGMALHISPRAQSTEGVRGLRLEKVAGRWYEIARFPNSREKGLGNVSLTFEMKGKDKVRIATQGFEDNGQGKCVSLNAVARAPRPDEPAVFKVLFMGIPVMEYSVINVDRESFESMMICDASGENLWFLSRSPQLDRKVYDRMVSTAVSKGFDVSRLVRTPQGESAVVRKSNGKSQRGKTGGS